MCDNIDRFINEINESPFEDIDEYLEMANYVIIYLENSNTEELNRQIDEYIDAKAIQEMARYGITPYTKALLFDVRFGFDGELFNDDEISSSIYNILYDFIEEGIEKYYYNELPFEEVKNRSKFTKEAIKEMDYEKFEKLVQEKIF